MKQFIFREKVLSTLLTVTGLRMYGIFFARVNIIYPFFSSKKYKSDIISYNLIYNIFWAQIDVSI